jgi:WD40 repeat protein
MSRTARLFTLILLSFLALLPLAGCGQGAEGPKQAQEAAATLPAEQPALVATAPPSPTWQPTGTPTPSPTSLPTITPTPTNTPIPGIGTPLPQQLAPIDLENVSSLTRLARWSHGSILTAAFTREGTILGLATTEGVRLYDPHTMELIRFYPLDGVVDIAFSPAGDLLAVLCRTNLDPLVVQHAVSLFSLTAAEPLLVIPAQEGDEEPSMLVEHIRFSPEADTLVGVGTRTDGTGPLWWAWDVQGSGWWDNVRLSTQSDLELTVSPDAGLISGRSIVTGELTIWERPGGEIFSITDQDVTAVSLSPNGELVAVIARDPASLAFSVAVWSLQDNLELAALPLEDALSYDSALAFSPEGDALLFTTRDGRLLRWRWGSGELETLLDDLPESVAQIVASPTGLLVMPTQFRRGLVWDLAGDRPPEYIPEFYGYSEYYGSAGDMAISQDGQQLVVLLGNRVVGRDIQDGSLRWEVSIPFAGDPYSTSISLSPAGNWLAHWFCDHDLAPSVVQYLNLVHLPDGAAYPLDISGNAYRAGINYFLDSLSAVAFSPDGSWMVTSDFYGTRLWSLPGGFSARTITYVNYTSLAFSPDSAQLAIGVESGEITIWRTVDGELLATLHGPPGQHNVLAFSPAGTLLAASGENFSGHTIMVWNLGSADIVGQFATDYTQGMAFSRDGTLLFANHGAHLEAWLVDGEELLADIELDRESPIGPLLSPDGSLLFTVDRYGVIEVWGVRE